MASVSVAVLAVMKAFVEFHLHLVVVMLEVAYFSIYWKAS